MTVRALVGRNPATCVIRQDVTGQPFDYLETTLDDDAISTLIRDLAEHQVRIKQYLRAEKRRKR